MSDLSSRSFEFVRNSLGRKLTRISRLFFLYQGKRDNELGAIQLEFSDGTTLFIDSGGSGDSIKAEDKPWVDPFQEPLTSEMREDIEQYGKFVMVDVSSESIYQNCIGKHIDAVHKIFNRFGELCGVQFDAEGEQITFAAQSDEAYVFLSSKAMRSYQLYLDEPPLVLAQEATAQSPG